MAQLRHDIWGFVKCIWVKVIFSLFSIIDALALSTQVKIWEHSLHFENMVQNRVQVHFVRPKEI